jgi:transketolase
MASVFGWERHTGTKGKIVGMRSFGASAPLKDLLKQFGLESDKVVAAAKEVLGK